MAAGCCARRSGSGGRCGRRDWRWTWERPWTTRGPCPWSTWASASRSGRPARPSSCGAATTGRSTTPCSIDGGDSAGDEAAISRPRRCRDPSDDEDLDGEASGQAEPAAGRGSRRGEPRGAGHPDPIGRRRRRRGRHRARGRRRRAGRVLARRDAAPPRVRPDDPGRAARRGAPGGCADPAARAAPDPPLRAAFARPPPRPAGDVPAQPRHGRAAADLGLATAGEGAPLAGRVVRHLGLDGAALAAAVALRPGALGVVGGARGVVRLRDAAHARHPAAARQGPRSGARPRRRHRQRLGRWDADRRELPDVQPEVGPAVAAVAVVS